MRRYKDWDKVREVYAKWTPHLEKGIHISPYELGIEWEFSPAEYNVWSDIRYLGLPLYPEYPVGRYFVDFGDPQRKIAIEVDGMRYHRNRFYEDLNRQQEIEKLGWRVYRIEGWMTYKNRSEFEKEDGTLDDLFYIESSEGILTQIYENKMENVTWYATVLG